MKIQDDGICNYPTKKKKWRGALEFVKTSVTTLVLFRQTDDEFERQVSKTSRAFEMASMRPKDRLLSAINPKKVIGRCKLGPVDIHQLTIDKKWWIRKTHGQPRNTTQILFKYCD